MNSEASASTRRSFLQRLRANLIGPRLDPFDSSTRHSLALVALLAWIGLGADGLSSSCYGPESAFLALGEHSALAVYLAITVATTVFVISLAYNQVIRLFPSGGGGYKAASVLIGPRAGLISGSALIVDYVLTIAISAASGMDAIFSLLPPAWQGYKLTAGIVTILILLGLNLRGVKESIVVLTPIFLGFFLSHVALIAYGLEARSDRLGLLLPDAAAHARALSTETSWMFLVAVMLRAYSVGAGTYTGIEAVSNNVHLLAEPRVKTGHWTMAYMAASLAFVAGGIILLYLLWGAQPEPGQTLNAVVFRSILESLSWSEPVAQGALFAVLAFEAGLLVVAANTGFLGGPSVLAAMASDRWVPRQFRQLSSRLVTQNGMLLMGAAALAAIVLTRGEVALLVVLYSINVFLTFTLSMLGLCLHWWRERRFVVDWRRSFALSLVGLLVTGSILLVIIVEKFLEGGWVTLAITSAVAALCLTTRKHYDGVRDLMRRIDTAYDVRQSWDGDRQPAAPDPTRPTAVFLVGESRSAGWYALQWTLDRFPGAFANCIFISVGEVDRDSYNSERTMRSLQARLQNSLNFFTSYCASRGIPATAIEGYGSDPLAELTRIADEVASRFPRSVFFMTKLVFEEETIWTQLLHNRLPLAVMRQLMPRGREAIVIPIRYPRESDVPQ